MENQLYLLRNGLIVTGNHPPFEGDILFDSEIQQIVDKQPAVPERARVVDCSGMIIRPGGIDAHTHFDLEISSTLRTIENINSGTRGALAGGITTIGDFATQQPGQSLIECYETRKEALDRESRCSYFIHLAVTDWEGDAFQQIDKLQNPYDLQSIKLFTTYKERGYDSNSGEIYTALGQSRKMNYLVMIHCEDDDIIAYNQKKLTRLSHLPEMEKFRLSRPSIAESAAVNHICYLNKKAGGNLYVVHCSTPESVHLLNSYREEDGEGRYLIESCPQFFLLDERQFAEKDGHLYASQPQLKSPPESEKLYKKVLQGMVDVIATDNCAFARKDKESGLKEGYLKVPVGMPGTQFLLPVTYSVLVDRGKLSLDDWVKMTAKRPAQIFGLKEAGVLEKGNRADITVFNPEKEWEITEKELCSGADWSPYLGHKVKGKVAATFLQGKPVFIEESLGNPGGE